VTNLGDHSLDLPFEPVGGQPIPLQGHVHVAGGLVVRASTADVPGTGPMPSLIFTFADPTGRFLPAILLVVDDDQAEKLVTLVTNAIDAAVAAARQMREATS
jgi:hypothetical protein